MKRRPRHGDEPAIRFTVSPLGDQNSIGLVLSGGGARAAYQAGALRALLPYLETRENPISVIMGSSIGAINGLITGACLKHGLSQAVEELHRLWVHRNFKNTFSGSPSKAFFKAIKVAAVQYLAPGPSASADSIFDPTPLLQEIDKVLADHGGLHPSNRHSALHSVGVMTTVEGAQRKPLLFLSSHQEVPKENLLGASFVISYRPELFAKHGFASAALPSILPPVELDSEQGTVRLVDGGISQNVPVDPAVRVGAHRVLIIDISGRSWWHDRFEEPHDTRPTWEVPAEFETFCMRPPETLVLKNQRPFGPILKYAVGSNTSRFITAVGPTWPLFTLLRKKLGEEVAYEVMSYCALDQEYLTGLLEQGFNETNAKLKMMNKLVFSKVDNFKQWAKTL